jgi:hypothetical protein
MKKLIFLFIGLALYALPGFAYTYSAQLFETSQDLGSENTYYSYIPVNPTAVSVSVDAWNINSYTAWSDSLNIIARVQTFRNNRIQNSMSNYGDWPVEHSYHVTWTTNVQQYDEFRITLRNNHSSGPGQCWARIDYYW